MTDRDPAPFVMPEQVTLTYYDPDLLEAVRAAARSDLQVVSVAGDPVEGAVEPSGRERGHTLRQESLGREEEM